MTLVDRKVLIDNVIRKIKLLPDIKIREVNDFADFLLSKIDDKITLEGIQQITSDSKAFDFLKNEENLYSVNDLKEKYR
jgi:hypothetical protein